MPITDPFFEPYIQQGINNPDSPILALHWKRYLFGFLLFHERKMTESLFFHYFELKRVSVQCNKQKKEFKFNKFSRILKPSKVPRLRCLRLSKNPTNEVGPWYVGLQAVKDQSSSCFSVLTHTYLYLNENLHNQEVNSHE